jgi:hypothetical protein
MTYSYHKKKIVAVLSANLEVGVALNIIGHLAISLGAYAERDILGRAVLPDASGTFHVGISKYPVIITKVKSNRLKRLIQDARKLEGVFLVDYPEQMLTTGHDDELANALSLVEETNINYLGAMLYGESDIINQLTGKFTLWH